MACILCVGQKALNVEDLPEDCILRFLDQIKKHYLSFQDKFLTVKLESQNLKAKIYEQSNRIDILETQLKEKTSKDDHKRRKTNSLENINSMNKDETGLLNKTKSSSSQESNESGLNVTDSELQVLEDIVVPKSNSSKTKSSEKNSSPNFDLPRRLKTWGNENKNNNNDKENQINEENNEWISKDHPRKKDFKSPSNRKWNISFIQPTTSATKLRQTTLNLNSFKTSIKPEPHSDDDMIAASPTSDTSNSSDLISRKKTIKKERDSDANLNVNKLGESTLTQYAKNNPSTSRKVDLVVPGSPVKLRNTSRSVTAKRLPLSPRKNDNNAKVSCDQNQNSNASISSSYSDDVLCIDDVDVPYDITCSALLDEMMDMSDSIPLKIKLAEEKRIKRLKDRQDEINKNANLRETDKPTTTKTKEEQTHNSLPIEINCPDCEMYFKLFGVPSSREEIERRISKCKNHKNADKLNETPDGFWDPIFRQFPEDDPRNETLIDTRYIDKKY